MILTIKTGGGGLSLCPAQKSSSGLFHLLIKAFVGLRRFPCKSYHHLLSHYYRTNFQKFSSFVISPDPLSKYYHHISCHQSKIFLSHQFSEVLIFCHLTWATELFTVLFPVLKRLISCLVGLLAASTDDLLLRQAGVSTCISFSLIYSSFDNFFIFGLFTQIYLFRFWRFIVATGRRLNLH